MTPRALIAALVVALCPVVGGAQGVPDQTVPVQTYSRDDVPAHLSVVDGAVTLEREGQAQPADVNVALLAGDRVRTERGRAEILFGDGSALDLDNDTSVDFLSDSLIRLRTGRLRLSITRVSNEVEYRVDAAGCSALIHSAGDFSVALSNARRAAPEADLAVFRGTAELENAHGRTIVRAGQHAWAREDTEPSSAASFNSTAADDFDHWVEDLRDARTGSTSSQYLPSEMRGYGGAFDAYGSWGTEPSYGTVWYPQVSAGWQPYSDGYWSAYGSYGWFWVGPTVWSWPTHHYGRWGVSSGRWFWVPGRQWAPAWVSWATSPGYVGWCPTGVDGRPVGWFNGSVPDARRGWTMATANQFSAARGPGTVVRPQRTASLPDRALTPQTSAPVVASARPGASVPLHSPTTTRMAGVPRLDVGPPSGQARPGSIDNTPLVPASRAMRETDAPPQAMPRSSQDRTPSWQARPSEPRPAPTVSRPGVWSDPSPSPWRAQPRPTDRATEPAAPDRPSRMPQALPDRGPVRPPDPPAPSRSAPGAAVPRNGPPPPPPPPSAGASRATSPPPASRGGQSSQSVPSRTGRGGTR